MNIGIYLIREVREVSEVSSDNLIQIENLKKYFPVNKGFFHTLFKKEKEFVHAVDDISFSIMKNEVFCLVGESGCGKSTTANLLVGLDKPTSGKFSWKDKPINYDQLVPKKGDIKSQIIFQNPFSALNPRMTLGYNLLHPLIIHDRIENEETKRVIQKAKYTEFALFIAAVLFFPLIFVGTLATSAWSMLIYGFNILLLLLTMGSYFYFSLNKKVKLVDESVIKSLDEIGLSREGKFYHKYPHEVSGGEKQRISIARSIILKPSLLIADEPTSMLDVSCRAGILGLIKSVQTKYELAVLFITHDLATTRHFADRVGVMYVGKIVEKGNAENVFNQPLHPYTKALIDAIPSPYPEHKDLDLPKGEIADAINPPNGCRFHPRCPKVKIGVCDLVEPEIREVSTGHYVACHFPLSN